MDAVTNQNPAVWVREMLALETEAEPLTDDDIVTAALSSLIIGPHVDMERIADICRMYSCDRYEVVARVEFCNGKPFCTFHKEPRGMIPDYLRCGGAL